jgi:phosphate ABC transporter phosphate-binding protein
LRVSTTAPTTAEQFLDLVVRSGLLSSATLQPYARRAVDEPDAQRALANLLVKDRLLTPYQAGQLLAGKYRSFFLSDKYKVLGFIGTGGAGHVFLCEHLVLQRLVAVKLLQSSAAEMTRGGQAAALERFVREARAVAALDHPNIVRVYDMERSGTVPFMVMEYVDGTSLHQVVAQFGALAVQRAAQYASQTAVGLQHAHEHGLIHRDIKPGNLLLDRSGLVKILDLGLARFLRDTKRNDNLTGRYQDDAIVGTIDFMSPEQSMNNPSIDVRSDIYSLGATFYYLLTGRAPFENETQVAHKLVAHQMRDPAPVESLRPDVPHVMSTVLKKMMAKKPEDRYQTPAEVAAALAPWTRTGAPVAAPPAAEMPKMPTSAYRIGLALGPPDGSVRESSTPSRWETPLVVTAASDGKETPSGSGAGTASQASGSGSRPAVVLGPPRTTEQVPTDVRRAALEAASHKPRSVRPALVGLAAVLVILVAAGIIWKNLRKPSDPGTPVVPVGPSGPALVLKGSGSTFIKPAMDYWIPLYEKDTGTKIEYSGIGSGRGVSNLIDKVLDFGCTDAFLTTEELAKARANGGEVVHVPLALGAVVVIYSLPDLDEQLRFTGPVLAAIYLGKIKKWNDKAIEACNPKLQGRLPDLDITVVHRGKDSSGTTFIWTDYLNKASPAEWGKVGVGNVVPWPVGQGAEKSSGVAKAVLQTKGAIGYVELSYALERSLRFAKIQNQNGKWIEPTLESVTAAAKESLQTIPADLRFSLTDALGDDSYPIAGTTWLVLHTNQSGTKGRELVKFTRWLTHEGQEHLKALRYAPLPPNLVTRSDELLAKVRVSE